MDRVGLVLVLVSAALSSSAPASADLVARPLSQVVPLRGAPGGAVVARVGRRTEFGSPLSLAVAARRGRWLGVITPHMPNGRLAWVDERVVRTAPVRLRLRVSLLSQKLTVLRGGEVLARFPLGVGAASSPTPVGDYAVTDKLPGARFSAVYGCCILALSGHQPHPPRGWTNGTRLAIHGGPAGDVSSGCLHASEPALRYLMAHVPLGTRVTIRRR